MPSTDLTSAVVRADRRVGALARQRVGAVRGGPEVARLVADATAPAFQVLVGLLIVLPGSRITGLRALAADPEAVRQLRVRAGAVDGFARAERAGLVK
jgi:hypothetical protein